MQKFFSGEKGDEMTARVCEATSEAEMVNIFCLQIQHMENAVAEQVDLLVDRLMDHLQGHPESAGEAPSVTNEKPSISWAWNDRKGWICPRCHRANGPHVDQCDCSLWTSTLVGRTTSGG